MQLRVLKRVLNRVPRALVLNCAGDLMWYTPKSENGLTLAWVANTKMDVLPQGE
jgi:hypothetical protein